MSIIWELVGGKGKSTLCLLCHPGAGREASGQHRGAMSLAGAGGQQTAQHGGERTAGDDAPRPTERGRNKPVSASHLASLWQMQQEAADSDLGCQE